MKYTFETALVFLKQGKKIRRASWSFRETIFIHRNEVVLFDSVSCRMCTFDFLSSDDILAEDWEVVE